MMQSNRYLHIGIFYIVQAYIVHLHVASSGTFAIHQGLDSSPLDGNATLKQINNVNDQTFMQGVLKVYLYTTCSSQIHRFRGKSNLRKDI